MGYMEDRLARKNGLAAPLPTKKERKPIPKKSSKKLVQEAKEREERNGEDSFLTKWFKARMKVMSHTCDECGLPVEHRVYKYAINSICHILAKRDSVAPSVKYHPLNFITLCPYHHDQLDKSNWDEIEKWGCWELIRNRLILVYPDLAPGEQRFFPESVLNYMKKHNAF